MEQKIKELENKLGEAAECIYHLSEMIEGQQKMINELKIYTKVPVEVPHNVVIASSVDARKYLATLGYDSISEYIFLNKEKTVRAEMDLYGYSSWEIKFSRV